MPDMPEWVSVWTWLRFMRNPAVLTPLPHQGIDPEAMSMTTYDELHSEWQEVGQPTMSAQRIVAVMTGSPLTEEIPF